MADVLSRRQLLQVGAFAGAAVGAGLLGRASATSAAPRTAGPYLDPLPWPAQVDGTRPVSLSVVTGTHRFSGALGPSPVLGYRLTGGHVLTPGSGGGLLGPTVVVPRGSETRLWVTNAATGHPLAGSIDPGVHGVQDGDGTAPRVVVHLHGGNSAPAFDGAPEDTFLPSATRLYRYANEQEATGLWYHDHALGLTRLNVYAGLAGSYLIRDTRDTGIDTGDGRFLPPAPYEVPLLLQDRTFDVDGRLYYPPAPWQPEFFGNTAVVNGAARPFLEVARGVYRFRLCNGSNARFYRLTLCAGDGRRSYPLWQIGTDGGLLDRPVRLTSLLLAPAERADLLVDFRPLPAGARLELRNDAPAPFPSGDPAEAPVDRILQFRVGRRTGWSPRGPIGAIRLRPVQPLPQLARLAARARVRTHSLVEIAMADDMVEMVTLDNRMYEDEGYAADPVAPGTLELWELANATDDTHPIHLHLVQFQILDRQPFDAVAYRTTHYADPATGLVVPGTGPYPAPSPTPFLTGPAQPPAANERGWKDTVQAPPGMVTRILVPFGAVAGLPVASPRADRGDYVWHCHILEHEDHDMMSRFRVS